MMPRAFVGALLSCVLGLYLATPAHAGIGAGNGEIGFDLGWTDFDSSVTKDTGGRAVFRGGYHITKLFQIEGQLGCSAVKDNSLSADISLCTEMVDGVFNFHSPGGNVVPYVLGGVGRAELKYDFDFAGNLDDKSQAAEVAAGVRLFFGSKKKIAVRLEASSLREKTFDLTSTHNSFTWGFTWRIGGGK